MKKLFTSLIAFSFLASCGNKKQNNKSNSVKNAVNQLTKNNKQSVGVIKPILDGEYNFNDIKQGAANYSGASPTVYNIAKDANQSQYISAYQKALSEVQVLVIAGNEHQEPLSKFYQDIQKESGIIYLDGEVLGAHNINSITFKVEQSAFYAGYLAAKFLSDNRKEYDTPNSKGLKIGVFGNASIPSATAFMGGFRQGIEFWNLNDGEMIGSEEIDFIKLGSSKSSYFTNDSNSTVKEISEKLVEKGADIILPVVGTQIIDTLEIIQQKNTNTKVVGVNIDQALQYPEYKDRFFTSIIKKVDLAMENALKHILQDKTNDEFGLGKVTVGSVKNGLTSIVTSGNNLVSLKDLKSAQEDYYISDAALNAKNKFKP